MISNTTRPKKKGGRLPWLLGAAAVLLPYALFVALPQNQRLVALRAEKQVATRTATTMDEAELSREQLLQVQAALQKLNRQLEDDRYKIRALGEMYRAPEARLETAQQVTETLQQFGLSINNQQFLEEPPLSDYMKSVFATINDVCQDEPVQFWEVELTGQYTDVRNFVKEIRSTGQRTFPISLEMQASDDGVHSWKIIFVI